MSTNSSLVCIDNLLHFLSKSTSNIKPNDHPLLLYANGLYETAEHIKPWEHDIIHSDFETIILWTIHIHSDLSLHYNNEMIACDGKLTKMYEKEGISLQERIENLKQNANKRILFGIGSWGANDFQSIYYGMYDKNMKNIERLQLLMANFQVLLDLGVDGFDIDCEEWNGNNQIKDVNIISDENLCRLITDFICILHTMKDDIFITFVPYKHEHHWLSICASVYERVGRQLVRYWLVQCYAGGDGNIPAFWIKFIHKNAEKIGIDDDWKTAQQYIIPGYDAMDKITGIEKKFEMCSYCVHGGFIWNMTDIYKHFEVNEENMINPIAAYAHAILKGLNHQQNYSKNNKEF